MPKVHVFAGLDRFSEVEGLLHYLHAPTSTAGAAGFWPSPFGREVGLSATENDAGSIAYALSSQLRTIRELAADHEGAQGWECGERGAQVVVLVYPPNVMDHPEQCSLEYLGVFGLQSPGLTCSTSEIR